MMEIITINKWKKFVIVTPDGKVIDLSVKAIGDKNVKLCFVDKNKASIYRKELWEKIRGKLFKHKET